MESEREKGRVCVPAPHRSDSAFFSSFVATHLVLLSPPHLMLDLLDTVVVKGCVDASEGWKEKKKDESPAPMLSLVSSCARSPPAHAASRPRCAQSRSPLEDTHGGNDGGRESVARAGSSRRERRARVGPAAAAAAGGGRREEKNEGEKK